MKTKKIIGLTAISLIMTIFMGLFAEKTIKAQAGESFDSNISRIFIAQGVGTDGYGGTQLYTAEQTSASQMDFVPNGQPSSINYNAMGFHQESGFLYAITKNQNNNANQGNQGNHLVQIGQEGVAFDLGTISGLPARDKNAGYNSGTFGKDGYADILFLKTGSETIATKTMWLVDIKTKTATILNLSKDVPNTADMVFTNGYLWSIDGNNGSTRRIYRINPSTGETSIFSLSSLNLPEDAYGAQWTYGNGNIGIAGNNTGKVFQIAIEDPDLNSPKFKVVASFKAPTSSQNDGAAAVGIADLGIQKVADKTFHNTGDTITYQFTITNYGTFQSSGWVMSDVLPIGVENPIFDFGTENNLSGSVSGNSITVNGGGLDVNETISFKVSVTVSSNAPTSIVNTVTIIGNELDPKPDNNTSTTTSNLADNPSIKIYKISTKNELTLGDTLTYNFLVVNTGNVLLTNVTIDDPLPGLIIENSGLIGDLMPGEQRMLTATYVVTQADVDTGSVVNTATVKGQAPDKREVTSDDSLVIPSVLKPEILINKTANKTNAILGETITYTLTVTNSGNVTLTNVIITDVLPGIALESNGVIGALTPGETISLKATYVVTQANIDAGSIENTATVTGQSPDNETVTSKDNVAIPAEQNPSILINKTADKTTEVLGETITYTLTVTNNGNVTLTDVVITDALPGTVLENNGAIGALAPNETVSLVATYVVTQADIDAGSILNTANVKGQAPDKREVTSDDSLVIPSVLKPEILINKTADKTNAILGETITYTLTVTNSGNVTLTNVIITDVLPGIVLESNGVIGALTPGETISLKATYVVTQADIDAGSIANTATVTGQSPDNETVTSKDNITIPGKQNPSILINKTADKTKEVLGETITYTLTVTNNGNVTLSDVIVTDALPGIVLESNGVIGVLAPGKTVSLKATYVVTQADIDAGSIANTAIVKGQSPNNETVTSKDNVTIPGNQNPSILIDKTADKTKEILGETITYTLTVTNNGNVTLTDVIITDALPGVVLENNGVVGVLAPGKTVSLKATYVVTQADIDAGSIVNTASATGQDLEKDSVKSTDKLVIPSDPIALNILPQTGDTNNVIGICVLFLSTGAMLLSYRINRKVS